MKFYIYPILFFFIPLQAFAQKENNVWVFGGLTGLDFNSSSPTMITSAMSTSEGCASICSASGELLFYSNGLTVYNKLHQPMPNGSDILGGIQTNATQGVAIAAVAGFSNYYYLFTLDEYNEEKTGQLRYSLIDMNLRMGLGDVVPGKKNILLGEGMSEKMIVAPACNGVWLITHHIDSSVFYAYKIATPVAPLPAVRSKTIGFNQSRNYYIGEMKLSHKADKIALGNWKMPIEETIHNRDPKIELFDFDKITGIVSNAKVIDSSVMAYSIEFSPDDSKLYYVEYGARLFQYDLSLLPDLNAVSLSKKQIGNKNEYKSLRCGPDSKLYITNGNFSTDIFRLNQPNNPAVTCDLDTSLTSLHKYIRYISFGSTNAVPIYVYDSIYFSRMDTSMCQGAEIIYANPDMLLCDSKYNLVNTIKKDGLYFKLKITNCQLSIDSIMVHYLKNDTSFNRFNSAKCFIDSVIIDGNPLFSNFLWSDGTHTNSKVFRQPYETQILYSWNNACKVSADSFYSSITNFSVNIPDAEICRDSSIIIDLSAENADKYEWQDGITEPRRTINLEGVYSITLNKNGCMLTEEFIVRNKNCDKCIIIPTGFSPNDDGKNDLFKPKILCDIKSYSIMIMNRFGQKVFESDDPSVGWDGRFNSRKENTATFYYLIKISFAEKFSKQELIKGDITLIN